MTMIFFVVKLKWLRLIAYSHEIVVFLFYAEKSNTPANRGMRYLKRRTKKRNGKKGINQSNIHLNSTLMLTFFSFLCLLFF